MANWSSVVGECELEEEKQYAGRACLYRTHSIENTFYRMPHS